MHMMKSPLMKAVGKSAWLIAALAAVHVGLCPMGINLWHSEFMMTNLKPLVVPIHYVIGIAGVISLIMFVMACMGCPKCGSGKCTCHKASGM